MKLFELDQGKIGKHVPEVYVDMDGVLADFFGKWAELDGKDHYKDIDNPTAKLALVREHPDFWISLKVLPNAGKLMGYIRKNFGHYKICTKPLEGDPNCEPQKRAWVKKHLSSFPPTQVIVTENKAAYATQADGTPNILIDDWGVNIAAWDAAGGIAIKHKDHKLDRTFAALEQVKKQRMESFKTL
jgi:5'(3')-deoxyribonucleotidase